MTSMDPLILNAARAFAMVSFSDGRMSPAEAERFSRLASQEAALGHFGHHDIADAWITASREVSEAQSFGPALLAIRQEVKEPAAKALMMRLAQAATIADGRLEAQENKAVFALADALGLDPDAY